MKFKSEILDATAFNRAIKRIAHQIIEKNPNVQNIAVIGIKTRGVPIAKRLSQSIFEIEGIKPDVGVLDITLYRDDLSYAGGVDPVVHESSIDFDVTGKEVILTDDVIYTGRTARAALEAICKFGRPEKIKLAAIVDRGHRELPIRPDFVGKNVPTANSEIIKVSFTETDGADEIDIYEK